MSGRDCITVLIFLTVAVIFWSFRFSGTVEVPVLSPPEYELPGNDEEILTEYWPGPADTSRWSFRIDPNEALIGDLVILPGIGPKLGEKIIRYREDNEPFHRASDLEKINGIGPKKRAKIEGYLIFK